MKTDKVIAVRNTKTVYRDGDNVIKLFDEHYSKADILNEALNQARVEETGLNIPKLNEVTKVNGRWAIVMDYIAGKTLQQLMDEHPDKIDEYLELFVNLQMEVHSKRAPLLNKLKDKMNRKISQADLNATIRYDLHTRLESMPKHNKVCHGDFNPSNIIIAKDGTPPTPRAHICCSGCRATSTSPRSISICSASRATPPSSTCRSGYPSSRLRNWSKARKKNASSCSIGWTSWTTSNKSERELWLKSLFASAVPATSKAPVRSWKNCSISSTRTTSANPSTSEALSVWANAAKTASA